MTPRDLTADLPAPRDDEPASLRDDIADELRDHLECAVRREELHSRSEPWGSAPRSDTHGGAEPRRSLVYVRVLERFGNPRAVARKLWFDAMREKLMGQRLSLVLQGLMAAAVIVMCLIVYQSLQQSAHTQGMLVAQLNKTQQELLESQRAANAQLVERLAALAQSGGSAPSEWNPLTVQCRFNTEHGPRAAGVKVVLTSESDNTAGIPTTEQISDENGEVDFGKVLYGQYALTLTAPNGMQRVQDVSIMPGQAKHVTIVCPQGKALTNVTPRLVPNSSDPPPAALAGQLWYYVRMQRVNNGGFKTWQRNKDDQYIDWLIGPQGQVLDVTPLTSSHFRQYNDSSADRYLPRSSLPPGPLNEFIRGELLISRADSRAPLPAPGDETIAARFDVAADAGTYAIISISACLLHPDTSEGMRLLILTPPRRLDGTQSGVSMLRGRGPTIDSSPTFSVIHDKPATVDIPLGSVRFAEFDRVLKAAPGLVAWRFDGQGLPEFQLRPGWESNDPNAAELPARLGIARSEQESEVILSGIEVIGWERIDTSMGGRPRGRRNGSPQHKVTAVLLVTPEERDLLERNKAKLGIAIDREGTTRTHLTPELSQALDAAPLPADESTTDAATSS